MEKIFRKLAWKFGYRIVKNEVNSKDIKVGFNSKYLSTLCNPDLVIDVGVGHGTLSLYESFPKANFFLIEPLADEYYQSIQKIEKLYKCEVVGKALGEFEDKMKLTFDKNDLQKASLFERTDLTKNLGDVKTKVVDVTTLDVLFESGNKLKGKTVVLKIDTEGGELSVLKGGVASLSYINFVIAEVSLAKRFEGSYEFEDLIEFMKENGFKVFSFLTMPFPSSEPRQRFTDILFQNVKKNSFL